MTWLLCDYGEVLSQPQSESDFAAIAHSAGRHDDRFWADYWEHRPAYDRADITAADYWTAVIGRRHDVEPDQLEHLIALDVASWLHPNVASVQAARRAQDRGHRLAILSNAPIEVAAGIDGLDWLVPFAPRIFSCRIGAIKPEPEVFVAALDALDAQPDEVVFIDDRAANVIAARSLGLQAVVFENPEQFDRW
jgi:putative hydrolase of the HAD superfamily